MNPSSTSFAKQAVFPVLAAVLLSACASTSSGTASTPVQEMPQASAPTYADLVTYAMAADLVAVVAVDDATAFSKERAPDVAPSRVRLYIESLTRNLLVSTAPVGESLVFVTDTDRDMDGDPPELEGREFIAFADLVSGRPGEVRLVSNDAFFPAGPLLQDRVRRVLRQLAAPDLLSQITGVRDVISIQGNLAGESETQMFVETRDGTPVSLSVVRRPGQEPQWGVSLGEIVDSAARPPAPETFEWYRFACSLPQELSESAFLQSDRSARERARADYAFVLSSLGACERRYT